MTDFQDTQSLPLTKELQDSVYTGNPFVQQFSNNPAVSTGENVDSMKIGDSGGQSLA